MDRRLTPANANVALEALRGMVSVSRYTKGETAMLLAAVTDLRDRPFGSRDRQLLCGEAVTVIDRQDGWAFVQAHKDGYCGYILEAALGRPVQPTHRVAVRATHVYAEPRVQAPEKTWLPFGSLLEVTAIDGKFAKTALGFVPQVHLRHLHDPFNDPVAVATMFLGAPYLWGGNSSAGIDCSGLVQAALLACDTPCPGDSDLQRSVGTRLSDEATLQRGDLVFWNGHVAMACDAETLIHANGHTMSVAFEETKACIERIAREGGHVLERRRP